MTGTLLKSQTMQNFSKREYTHVDVDYLIWTKFTCKEGLNHAKHPILWILLFWRKPGFLRHNPSANQEHSHLEGGQKRMGIFLKMSVIVTIVDATDENDS